MDDRVGARDGRAERLGLRHVPLDDLGAGEPFGVGGVAHERPHRPPGLEQAPHEMAADEPGRAGDEHGHSKFFQ